MKRYLLFFLVLFNSSFLIGCILDFDDDDNIVCDMSDLNDNIIPAARYESGNSIEDTILSWLRLSAVVATGVWRLTFGGNAPRHATWDDDLNWRNGPLVLENKDSSS